MPRVPYRIALASRGAGAFAYTYTGPAELERGQLAAVRFRNRLELGVLLGIDPTPPEGVDLQPLFPVASRTPQWGERLLDLSELTCAAPHELLPRLLPAGSASGMRLSLAFPGFDRAAALHTAQLLSCAGHLTPAKRKLLVSPGIWENACQMSAAGSAELVLDFAGMPGVVNAKAAWRFWYDLAEHEAAAHSLAASERMQWPGSYLAGLAYPPSLAELRRHKAPSFQEITPRLEAKLSWDNLDWPADWDICRKWPEVKKVPLRRTQCSWAELRSPSGLEAELAGAISAGVKTLLILPQAWMLDTLWPLWALLAPWLFRYDAAMPAGELTHILHAIVAGGCIAGTEAAWRLALYVPFEQVILVDPSHPQWQPEAAPWLDSRSALLLGCASAGARLSLIEMGLSAFDSKLRFSVDIFPPHNPAESGAAEGTQAADINPLPLKLREPDRRRLVYFNRLGASRGLTCAECASSVNCPQCRSRGIHFSQQSQSYLCPTCGLEERSLRCPRCGLANLAAHLPGLEAVRVRPGELVVTSASGALPGPESGVVLGTARLLEPVPGYWPEQVVYVDPEERDLLDSDWRSALDQALRLGSLYANPGLATICIVSARLAERLKQPLASAEATDAAQQESQLRKLAGLAPWGCLYRLRLLAGSLPPLQTARELLGQVLSAHPATSLLRIGRPFVRMKRCELHGYLLNPALSWPELQELRWQTLPLQVTLSFHAERGPWL